jgi:hypothetical protein
VGDNSSKTDELVPGIVGHLTIREIVESPDVSQAFTDDLESHQDHVLRHRLDKKVMNVETSQFCVPSCAQYSTLTWKRIARGAA